MARKRKPSGEIPPAAAKTSAGRHALGAETAPLQPTPEQARAGEGKTTLAEASRDRLAKPALASDLWSEFEKETGERVDPLNPPTWAELIAAKQARRAASSENGTRDAKELRDAAEGSKSDSARVAFLISLDGLPKTNAVRRPSPTKPRRDSSLPSE